MTIYAYDSEQGLNELKKTLSQILGEGLYFSGFTEVGRLIDACTDKRYDAAFVDIDYLSNSGMLLLGELYRRYPNSNYIGVTSEEKEGEALTLHRIHASGYILKPYKKETIEDTLKHLRFSVKKSKEENVNFLKGEHLYETK